MQDPNADTEWNDILRKHGIIPPRTIEKDKLDELIESSLPADEAAKRDLELRAAEMDELDRMLEDDPEDERAVQAYRLQRIAEMKKAIAQNRFGSVVDIGKADFVREVSDACKTEGMRILVLLYDDNVIASRRMDEHWRVLAEKFPSCKFVRIQATRCIENYPSRLVPTVLFYTKGDMQRQLVGAEQLGGSMMTDKDVEWILSVYGMIDSKMTEPPSKNNHENNESDDDS